MDPTIDQQQWRDQVAAAVRSVKPITFGGTCWLRSALGAMALTHLGMRPRPVIGGAVFRSGPDPTLDAVNFCGSSNYAEWVNGNPLFHVWLDVNGDIVDFAPGDWHQDADLIEAASVERDHSQNGMPSITWQVKPPEYVWQPAATLAGRPGKTPALGELWYREGWKVPKEMQATVEAHFRDGNRYALDMARPLWAAVKEMLPDPLPQPPARAEARRLRQMAKRASKSGGALPPAA